MNRIATKILVTAAGAACALAGSVAHAQLEEVIVTAQKRAQSVQDVPISVTAFSGDQLDALGMSDFTQITQQVPSLQLNTWSPKLTIFNMRGISQNTFNDNNEGPIAVYVDDAYIGSLNGISGQLFDMERVEVLRGPQGTLFGRNATGGLIQYVSRDASDAEFNGYLEARAGRFDDYSVEGAMGGSITDNVRFRVAGRWNEADGYIESVDTILPGTSTVLFPGSRQDIGGVDGYSLRGTLQVDFSNQLTGNFWLKYSEDNQVPTGGYVFENCALDANGLCPVDPEGRTITGDGVIDLFGQPADVHEHYNEAPGNLDREQFSAIGRFDYEFSNGMELTSITNYMTNDFQYLEDGDALAVPVLTFRTFVDYSQFSQELRLAGETERMRWQAGFYYLDMEWDGGTAVTGAPAFGNIVASGRVLTAGGVDTALTGMTANPFNGFEGAVGFQNYVIDSRNWSLFGQVEYDLNEKLTAILGLRYSQDDKEIDWQLNFTDNFNPTPLVIETSTAFAAVNPGADEIDYGDIAARIGLEYDLNDSTLLFASANRGIKGGNWSIGVTANINPNTFRHGEEVLWSYEAGFKTTLDTLRVNGTFFYYDYSDYQAFSLAGGGPFISNSDEASAIGGEIEFFWTPNDNWDFSLGGAFLDTEVEQILGASSLLGGGGGVFINNAELPNAPTASFNYLGRYNFNIGPGNLAVQVDGVWYDDQFLEVTNGSGSFQEAYNVSNASLIYLTANEKLTFSLFVRNFTDEEYLLYSLDLGDLGTTSYYAPPITYGGSVRFSW